MAKTPLSGLQRHRADKAYLRAGLPRGRPDQERLQNLLENIIDLNKRLAPHHSGRLLQKHQRRVQDHRVQRDGHVNARTFVKLPQGPEDPTVSGGTKP